MLFDRLAAVPVDLMRAEQVASRDCKAHEVAWRARCLAAEAPRLTDEERAAVSEWLGHEMLNGTRRASMSVLNAIAKMVLREEDDR